MAAGMIEARALGNAPIAQGLAVGGGQLADLAVGLREPVGDRVGVGEQERSGLGRHRPARPAVQQPDAELPLERRDLLRHRRLGEAEGVAGLRERALPDDLAERQQAPRIHGAYSYADPSAITPRGTS